MGVWVGYRYEGDGVCFSVRVWVGGSQGERNVVVKGSRDIPSAI